MEREQVDSLSGHLGLPGHIREYIEGFDGALSPEEFSSDKFAYRVIFVPKTVNHVSQADQVIQFIRADSPLAKGINASIAMIRETEKPKRLPGQIVKLMQDEGFTKFEIHHHTDLGPSRCAAGVTISRPGPSKEVIA
jgi:hypothetical protein